MAAVYTNKLLADQHMDDRFIALSAGSNPSGESINPKAQAVMDEIGQDMSYCFPKPWTPEVVVS